MTIIEDSISFKPRCSHNENQLQKKGSYVVQARAALDLNLLVHNSNRMT